MPESMFNKIVKGQSRLESPDNSFLIYFEDRPSCIIGCPAGVDIKAYVNLIADKKYEDAVSIIRQANPFPGICGRVCTHPCEEECGRKDIDESVSIRILKRFAADYELSRKKSGLAIEPVNQQKIAIVGSGPAGLTAANDLALAGFPVTVFEEGNEPGGLLSWGIPDFRLPKNIVRSEIRDIQNLGVEIQTGKRVESPLALLQQGYGAVILTMGCQNPVKLDIEDTENLIDCLDFLRKVSNGKMTSLPGKTLVIGGGNAALDSARTALRLGSQVTIAYRRTEEQMPAEAEEIHHAKEEGIKFQMLAIPHKVVHGGMEFQQAELGEPDDSGRRSPVPVPHEFFTIEADNIILALGSKPDVLENELKTTKWNTLETDEWGMTSHEGVFAAGDIVSGPSTIVDAIGSGHCAANGVIKFLLGQDGKFGAQESKEMLIVEAMAPECQDRIGAECISIENRHTTFDEVEAGITEADALAEANRCRRCGSCSVCSVCLSVCDYRNAIISIIKTRESALSKTGNSALAKIPFDLANNTSQDWKIIADTEETAVTIEPLLARVDNNFCIACGRCEDACPYQAIRTVFDTEGNVHAQVDPSACRGCGACAAACPSGAMRVGYSSNEKLFREIYQAVKNTPDGIVKFSCIWHDFDAGISTEPGEIKLQCTRRASPALILEALSAGAKAVAVVGCSDDECHYLPGAWMGPDIVESCKNILENIGIDSDRIAYADDEASISFSVNLKPFQNNADKIPDTKSPIGRALNAAQILMAQPDLAFETSPNGKYLLGMGCLAMSEPVFQAHGFERPEIINAVQKLLESVGIEYKPAPGIHISGNSLKEWGMDSLYQQYSDSIIQQANDSKGLIIPTPKTWVAFKENYPDMKIISLPELLTGKLKFNELDITIAYHKSCADSGDFDSHCLDLLREVKGLKIVEIDGKCGDTGWRLVDSGSREKGTALLKRAEEAGASILISSSTRCTAHLDALKSGWCQSAVEVQDIFSFLAGNLKEVQNDE